MVANFLKVVECIFNGRRNFVMKTKVMMRLHDQKVLVTGFGRAILRAIVGNEGCQRIQQQCTVGAVNAESIFFGLTSAAVVRVSVFGPSTKDRSNEREQAKEFHFGNGDV